MDTNNMPSSDVKFEERQKRYADTVACRRTDRVLAAPQIMYLPILMYGETTIQDMPLMYWRPAGDIFWIPMCPWM